MSRVNSKKAANSKKRMVHAVKQMEYADPDGQTYGVVEKALGMCRFSIACIDGITRKGCVRGAIQKKTRVEARDVVIVSLRDFDDSLCDIIYKYDSKGAAQLRKEGVIPNDKTCGVDVNEDDDGITFDFDTVEVQEEKAEEVEVDDI